jgi:hypothetical protein
MEKKNIQIPYLFNPREYQLPLLRAMDNGITRAVIVWNRRSGKDKTCFNYLIRRAVERVGTYFYFLPSYTLAKKVVWDNIDNDGFRMLDHIPEEIIKSTNATELKIELINGSVIQLIAADEFKNSGVGTNPIGVVFSEYSISSPEAWKFVSPILAANGGWAIFNFTPRGMNHAYALLQQAKENKNWFSEVLTLDDTHVLTPEALEEERTQQPQDIIEQEYFCKFIEGAGAFFRRITENVKITDPKPNPLHRYKMGVDLAKHQDYTVITVLDLMTFNVVEIERFNQIDWNLQKAKIEAMYLRYFKPAMTLDSTGLGDPIYDDLENRGMRNILGYKFTENSRKDLLTNLQLLLEQGKIKIPENEILIEELRSMRYELIGERGKTAIRVPEGLHDDMIMSLALSVWDIPQNPLPAPGSLLHLTRNAPVQQTSFE